MKAPSAAPAAAEGVTATELRGGNTMTLPASQDGHHEPHAHPHKRKQLAKRLESWVSVATAAVAVILLVVAGYAILGQGPQVPPWMH